jgi:hypothetical protein
MQLKERHRIGSRKGVALTLALALCIGAAASISGETSPASAAACNPGTTATRTLIAGTYYYDLKGNACAMRAMAQGYGDRSGYAGVAALLTSWIPGAVAKSISTYLGTASTVQFFTQGAISRCTKNLTLGATLTFVHGQFVGCKAGTSSGKP